ncbi:hypothetical protein H5410_015383 [Solanum commersonii]|uniref:Uncharacterized protein n=1 Tax=Solanum commersonii TaxID=4109 RepID=A0A9J5ZUB8_SOLCO|nr:hypothetical protein H5410_015383 [Solanum commersonii]
MNTKPIEKWANFFDNNMMFAKEMNLSNINIVVKKGEKVIELNKDETDKETENWKQELTLYVVGDSPTIIFLQLKGPHMLNTKPIIIKVWSANFDFNKEVLQTVSFG